MTKKDYILIAEVLKRSTPLAMDRERAMLLWERTIANFADALSKNNPRFDRARFSNACKGI